MPTSTPTGRFAVVVCPDCRHAHGIDLAAAKSACSRCGARRENKSLRVFYATDDAARLPDAVGTLEAKLMGGPEAVVDVATLAAEIEGTRGPDRMRVPPVEPDEESLIQYAASAAAGIQSKQKACFAILSALDESQPDGFTEEQVALAFVAAGFPAERAETEMRRGLVNHELYEPRAGRYKLFPG